MRRFYLYRERDESGVSGTGRVADGCQFNNGSCALIWKSELPVNSWYPSSDVILRIHGHKGATTLIWIDDQDEEVTMPQTEGKESTIISSQTIETD